MSAPPLRGALAVFMLFLLGYVLLYSRPERRQFPFRCDPLVVSAEDAGDIVAS